MNAIIIEHPAAIKAEISSFASLAHTLSRLSVQKAQWAREARMQGKSAVAARFETESVKQRVEANWYLVQAMNRKDRHYARES